jgi:hypothetical protein
MRGTMSEFEPKRTANRSVSLRKRPVRREGAAGDSSSGEDDGGMPSQQHAATARADEVLQQLDSRRRVT